ncbi:RHS repeat domain-containing protein, partial [Pedobacter frigoris]
TAEGEKLQKKYVNGPVTMITAYNKGIEYVGRHVDTLQVQYIQTSEGRAWFDGTKFIYEYNLTDHLGNVRATIDADPADVTQRTARLVQENSYYPFGMVMPGTDINYTAGNKNNYLFTGKEFQEELGEYDHGARFYDPAIARWSVADPLAEQFYGVSPYNYVFNNPMGFTDPTGMAPEDRPNGGYYDSNGGYVVEVYLEEYFKTMTQYREMIRNGRIQERIDAITKQLNGPGWGPIDPLETEKAKNERLKREAYNKSNMLYTSKKGNFGNNVKNPRALDYSTVGKNLGGGTYAGGDNPRNNDGSYSYTYVPTKPFDPPGIGHDRRYDNLKAVGLISLIADHRAIGADWVFVKEQLLVAGRQDISSKDKVKAYFIGTGLGFFSLTKTIHALSAPGGMTYIQRSYKISNVNVTNEPDK